MPLTVTRADGLVISDDQGRLDLDRCARWLAGSYWAANRSPAQVARSFAGSRVYGVYTPSGSQLALTRAVTDGVSFCWLGDVYVDEAERGRGIGTWLVSSVVKHLRAEGVPRFLLGTRDAHGVYAKLGFTALSVPELYMELDDRPTRATRADVDPAVLDREVAPAPQP